MPRAGRGCFIHTPPCASQQSTGLIREATPCTYLPKLSPRPRNNRNRKTEETSRCYAPSPLGMPLNHTLADGYYYCSRFTDDETEAEGLRNSEGPDFLLGLAHGRSQQETQSPERCGISEFGMALCFCSRPQLLPGSCFPPLSHSSRSWQAQDTHSCPLLQV